jgi:hypothetical protein
MVRRCDDWYWGLPKRDRELRPVSTPFNAALKALPSEAPPLKKELYFFYGILIDPTTLFKVLGIHERPEMKPARLFGYKCKLWFLYILPSSIKSTGISPGRPFMASCTRCKGWTRNRSWWTITVLITPLYDAKPILKIDHGFGGVLSSGRMTNNALRKVPLIFKTLRTSGHSWRRDSSGCSPLGPDSGEDGGPLVVSQNLVLYMV